jgi:hypothetical protein
MLRCRGAEEWRSAVVPVLLLAVLLVVPPTLAVVPRFHVPAPPEISATFSHPAVSGPWTNLTPLVGAGPPGVVGAGIANDSFGGDDLWFGGSNGSGAGVAGLTWTFQNGSWTNRTASLSNAPPARTFGAMTYDPQVSGVVLFGGLGDPSYLNDTWIWKAGSWTNFSAIAGVAPPPRAEATMTFDEASGQVLLFGGLNSSGPLADTWAFGSGRWSRLSPLASPPASCCGAMAYDSHDSAAILVLSPTVGFTIDTWSFSAGNWTNLTGATAPSTREWPTLVSDPAVGGVLLFGGSSVPRPPFWPLGDSWLLTGRTWTYAAAGSGSVADPAPRWGAVAAPLVPSTPDGCFLLVGGGGKNGTESPDGGDWMGCGNRTVWTNGTGGPGGGRVPPAVTLTSDGYAGVVPFIANLTVQIVNGTAPFNLSICTSIGTCNTTAGWPAGTLIHSQFRVRIAGDYLVSALVSDVNELSGSATISILGTNPGPLNATPDVGPTSGTAPLDTTFRLSLNGGTGPYSIQWTFGDGTTAAGSPDSGVVHSYREPGVFHPSLVITDADQRSISVGLPLITVVAPIPPTNTSGSPSAIQQYVLPGSILLLGLAVAVAVYVVRRRRVEREADETLREVQGDEVSADGSPPAPSSREAG